MKTFFNLFKTLIFSLVVTCFWGLVSLYVKNLDVISGVYLPLRLRVPGIILMIAGGSLASVCALSFAIFGKGTPFPPDAPKEFVSTGPYKYVRNPMYIGGFMLFEGFAFVNLSVSMIIFGFLWLLIVHLFTIFYEEKTLEKQFGKSYLDYKKKVHRWLPTI